MRWRRARAETRRPEKQPSRTRRRNSRRFTGSRTSPLIWAGLVIVAAIIALTVLAPWIAPYDPVAYQGGGRLQPPGNGHLMGTDQLGRDIFSRVAYGGRIPLVVAFASVFTAMTLGALFGWASGYAGGYPDRLLSLAMDSLYSFPSLILAIVIAAVLGPGLFNMVVAVAVVFVPTYYRVARAQALQLKELEMVAAARALGASNWRILFRHIAPNTLGPLIPVATYNVADAVLTAAGLSFLGLGVQPPTPDWGFDLQNGQSFLPSGSWWPVTFPGLMILLLTLGFAMLGEGVGDRMRPRR